MSVRSMLRSQLAGRPVDRYVNEALTAKSNASAVQPDHTPAKPRNQPRMARFYTIEGAMA